MDTNNDSNFIGGFGGSLRDQLTGLDPDPSGVDSIHVSGCITQLGFDAATSINTNGRIPISEGLQAASGKGKFQHDNRNGCQKYIRNTVIVMTMNGSQDLMKKGKMCT